ncbi:hypothetical protein B0H17DRAFT_403801 [Mycena rosella]|uniref:DUF7514 domain-containing protein n=1 Tax=Mycena rosella TaxID=1033263 RepID=A0AAD7G0B9_MYCRO|nr:hypothetical protein B0H17DRAFT_403801 [Mycena rosella]
MYQLSPDDQSYQAPPRADTYATPSRATPASSVPQRQDGYFPPQTSPAHIAAPRADTTKTPLRGDASYAVPPHADSPVRREDGYLPSQDDRTPPVGAYTSPLRVTPAPGTPQREDGYRPPQDARAPPHGDTYQAETYSTSPQAGSPASVPRREGTHLSRPEDRISEVGGYTSPHTEVYAAPQRADPALSAPPREEYHPLRDDGASNIGGYTPPPRADAPVSRGETYNAPPRYAYAPSPRADTRTAPPRTNASTAPDGYSPPARADTVEPVRGWGPFFAEDISPTPVLTQLLDALFAYLDTGRTGYLAPEDYSRFLVNQGYVGAENVWNANLTASLGKTKKESADAALKRNYDALGIEHVLRPRTPDRPAAVTTPPTLTRTLQSFGASFARTLAAPPPGSSAMPLLTRKGFADITAIALLTDPARACGALARVLRMYELPLVRAWGALPRGALPRRPIQGCWSAFPGGLPQRRARGRASEGSELCRVSLRWRMPWQQRTSLVIR